MGQVLSEPVTTKHSASGQDERFAYGVTEMQGWRISMEDAHAHILDVDANQSGSKPSEDKSSFFAVYDGHGGSAVARYAGDTVHSRLAAQEEYKAKDYPAALKRTFLATDEDMRANNEFRGDPSGCTAVVVLAPSDGKLYCANAGDSRSVLSVKGKAKPLSYDHKPVNKDETARIVAAGGFVHFNRVNGNLALSRALGDFEFKQNSSLEAEKQVVTADPEIIIHDRTDDDEFVIIACDGIWDVLDSQECVDCVRRGIAERQPLDKICESMVERCLSPDSDCSGVGCDNMTIMVVALLNGKSLDAWYDDMAKRVESKEGHETPSSDDLPNPLARRAGNPNANNWSGASGLGGLVAGLRGNAINLDHYNGSEDDSERAHEESEDDEESLLANLGSALRREGIEIDVVEEHEDDKSSTESMDVDADQDADADTADQKKVAHEEFTPKTSTSESDSNSEIPHPSVQAEGLTDKSEDPTKS